MIGPSKGPGGSGGVDIRTSGPKSTKELRWGDVSNPQNTVPDLNHLTSPLYDRSVDPFQTTLHAQWPSQNTTLQGNATSALAAEFG